VLKRHWHHLVGGREAYAPCDYPPHGLTCLKHASYCDGAMPCVFMHTIDAMARCSVALHYVFGPHLVKEQHPGTVANMRTNTTAAHYQHHQQEGKGGAPGEDATELGHVRLGSYNASANTGVRPQRAHSTFHTKGEAIMELTFKDPRQVTPPTPPSAAATLYPYCQGSQTTLTMTAGPWNHQQARSGHGEVSPHSPWSSLSRPPAK
jgi:hypothetical protein